MTRPDIPAPEIAYVALVSRDPAATTDFFATHLGLPRQTVPGGDPAVAAFAVGRSAVLVVPSGHGLVEGAERPGVHHIALAAAEPDAAAASSGIAVLAGHAVGPDGFPQPCLDPAATVGVRTRLTRPLALAPSRSAAIERIDHIGVASDDNDAALAAFCDRLGGARESRQTDFEVRIPVETFTSDKYGVVYHTRAPEPVGGLHSLFVTVGDCELEFLQDFDPRSEGAVARGTAGSTRQDRGAIARYVERNGPGLHHLALKTPAIDPLLATLDRAGVAVIDRAGRPGSRRARIGFVQPRALGGILIHFVERA